MTKKIVAVIILILAALSFVPAAQADEWDDLLERVRKENMINQKGTEIIAKLRSEAPDGTELELWQLIWFGYERPRASAAVALIDKLFPESDPARWEEVGGFITRDTFATRQLAALDALFAAVMIMSKDPDMIWGAAYLLQAFGHSGMGKVIFIDKIPSGLRAAIDKVIEVTGLRGDWSSREELGRFPLLPSFGGYIGYSGGGGPHMQFIDGAGRLAQNGSLVWNRKNGKIYKIIEKRSRFPWFLTGAASHLN